MNAPPEGVVEGQDFVLRRGSAITGRVRNREGELLSGVSVTAWGWVMGSEGDMEWVQRNEVRTDNEGMFVLDGLRDGSYEVNFQCTGYANLEMPGLATGTRDLQVTLLPNARLEGLVLESDGVTPIPTFTIKVFQEVDGDGNPLEAANMVQSQDFADREGKFLLKDVPEGQGALVATSGNKVSRRLGGIVVAAGGSVANLRLQLAVGGRLKVTVRDATGTALKDANVSAGRRQPDGSFMNEYWSQTDPEGIAMFAAMSDGTWTLWANYAGKVQETKVVNVGAGVEAELEMVLRVGGTVVIQVKDPRGNPVDGATVSLSDAATGQDLPMDWGKIWQAAWRKYGGRVDWDKVQYDATHTDLEGRFVQENVKPGVVKVRVGKEGFLEKTVTVTVQDGVEVDVPVPLDALPDPNAPPPPVPGPGAAGEGDGTGGR